MLLILQVPVSILLAVAGDWAIHVHTQSMWAVGHEGLSTTKYRLGPPLRLILILVYLIPVNYLLFTGSESNLAIVFFLVAIAAYGICAGTQSVKDMTPAPATEEGAS